jgi:hypothetical protein
MGDLSAAVCPGHPQKSIQDKYVHWAENLFEKRPTKNPKLKRNVLFWMKPWKGTDVGIWKDFGPTNLTFLEYLLIGVGSTIFPETLLNSEGTNRTA